MSKQSKRLSEVDTLMYAHGTIGKIAFHRAAIQTYAPVTWLLLSLESGKSEDHDVLRVRREMCQKVVLINWVPRHGSDVESLDRYLWENDLTGRGTLRVQYTLHRNRA